MALSASPRACWNIYTWSCGVTTIEMTDSKPCMFSLSPGIAVVLIGKKVASFLRNRGKHSKDRRHFLAVMLVRKGTNEQRRKLFFSITRTASPAWKTRYTVVNDVTLSLNEINNSVEYAAHSCRTFWLAGVRNWAIPLQPIKSALMCAR